MKRSILICTLLIVFMNSPLAISSETEEATTANLCGVVPQWPDNRLPGWLYDADMVNYKQALRAREDCIERWWGGRLYGRSHLK